MEIDLNDKPGSLLDPMNAWREKVAMGELSRVPGLSRPVELKILNLLTSRMDFELILTT